MARMVDGVTVDAAALGVDHTQLQRLVQRVQRALDTSPLPSVQFALAKDNALVLFETLGNQTNDTRYLVYSCTKPLVAAACWKLMGEGLLDIHATVSRYLPVFGGGGKERVTVEQLLCHSSGFPNATLGPPHWWDSTSRLAQMAHWELEWTPGTQVVYHPLSAWWVLAEIISAVSGVDYRRYIQQAILQPCGLSKLRLGVPRDEGDDIAAVAYVGEPPDAQELRALFGREVQWPADQDAFYLSFNEPDVRALGLPGGGAVSTAADMALFYQALLHNPDEIWERATLAQVIGKVYCDVPDPHSGAPAHRGLGVVVAGDDRFKINRGMGEKVSAQAFGHQGVGGQVAWGDPQSGLSFCLLTNGLDANLLRSTRLCTAASNLAASCLLA